MNVITLPKIANLSRFAYTPHGAFGILRIGKLEVYTVERPWADNTPFKACIQVGAYPMLLRESETVTNSTKGKYKHGWEVTEVEGRTDILIHPGNTFHDVVGCIAVGTGLGTLIVDGTPTWSVTNSVSAFGRVMAALNPAQPWVLNVTEEKWNALKHAS